MGKFVVQDGKEYMLIRRIMDVQSDGSRRVSFFFTAFDRFYIIRGESI